MGVEEAEKLQQEIDRALLQKPRLAGLSVTLDQGSDVIDLSDNVDVLVLNSAGEQRLFSIVTARWLHGQLGDSQHDPGPPPQAWGWPREWAEMHTTGGPLLVVRTVSAELVIGAVLRFLYQETGDLRFAPDV